MTGWKDWQIGEVVTESDFQNLVQDQVIQRYADASARTSTLGTAVAEGMVSYLEDTNKVEVYDGSSWVQVGQEGDITSVTAGTGLTGGGTAGDVTLNADYAAIGSAVSITASQVTDLTASAAAINTIDDGTAGYTALAAGTAGITYQPVSHNYIINGAFDVWQRGDGPFNIAGANANAAYTADRWNVLPSGGTGATTRRSFTSDELTAIGYGDAKNYLKMDVTTGDNFYGIRTRIEDVRTLAGQTATLSFYAKGTNPGTGGIRIDIAQVFDPAVTTINIESGFTLNASWTRYEYTFTLGSLAGQTIGANSYLEVSMSQAASDTSPWELNLWGVQLEAGSVATPFKRHAPSLGLEKLACQRYYARINAPAYTPIGTGFSRDTINGTFYIKLPTTMRVAATSVGFNDLIVTDRASYDLIVTASADFKANPDAIYWRVTNVPGATAFRPAFLTGGTNGYFEASAEL